MIRSLLYVPANNERFIARAHERGADAIILDLEDAVPEDEKDAARDTLAGAVPSVSRNHASAFVRVNAGPRLTDDAVAAARAGAFGLVIPKVRDVGQIESLTGTLRGIEAEVGRKGVCFLALIEDPAGFYVARDIARLQRVIGLMLGGEDFANALGAQPLPEVLRGPKLLVHYAAKAENKLSLGILRSIADYNDIEGLTAAAREARMHGFDGATCVHPSIVPILNEAFRATPEEIAWAERVVAAAHGETAGAFVLDGKMIDAPVIARALLILERAERERKAS